jgi:hypothetical protein
MPLYSWLLSTLLIGQAADGPPLAIPAQATPGESASSTGIGRNPAEQPGGGTNYAPARGGTTNKAAHATADQMVAEALPPAENSTSSQRLPLISAITAVPDRTRQLEAIHGYWRLVRSVGDYHCCIDRQQRLSRLTAAKDEAGDLRTAQAVATARLHEAELRVTTAQHELAAALHLPETAPLPWPADRPLTEAYRTRFAELFAGKRPPDRARMLDQMLPLRHLAVESHASALLAAEESLDAAIELHSSGQRPLALVLQALEAQVQQQQAFLAAVCRYNDDIADYALAVVPPQTAPEVLLTTLIIRARPASQPAIASPNVPASFQQPEGAPAIVVPAIGESPLPDRAPVRGDIPIAPPQASATVAPAPAASPAPNNDDSAPHLAPPQESDIPLLPSPPAETPPPASGGKSSGAGTVRATFKPVVQDVPRQSVPQLVARLYDNRDSLAPAGRPLRLVECLQSAAPSRRLEAIEAYWTARQATADCRLLAEEKQWLDALKPALVAQNPPSPTDMLDLRSARSAVEARSIDAQADCLAAEFQLAAMAGLPTDKALPLPASVPFAGRFPISLRESDWRARQAEAEIPRWEVVINDHAAAVAEADAARAAATAGFFARRTELEHVFKAIDVQEHEAAAFGQGLAEYNRCIAQYVTRHGAANLSPADLAASLMASESI